jgi:6-pyruvoyltetrahydropterin/6-carboxytetrahydropterin synthase
MYELIVEDEFSAAHMIKGYQGKCSRLHGHNYKVKVAVVGEKLNEIGMVVDFSKVKAKLEEVLDMFDHYDLNERLKEDNVTAEIIARYIYYEMKRYFNVSWVEIAETDRYRVRYYEG